LPHFVYSGKRIHFLDQGVGRPLFILPGNTSASGNFGIHLNRLSRSYRVVILDYPGTGLSDRLEYWPNNWWTDNCQCACALLDSLGLAGVVLVGTSSGSAVALSMTRLVPDRVKAIVMDSYSPVISSRYIRNLLAFRASPSEALVAFWRQAHGSDWDTVVAQDNDLLRRIILDNTGWQRPGLEGITCPVLLTGSSHDVMYPNLEGILLDLARDHANRHVVMQPMGGHTLMNTCPSIFCDVLDSFLLDVLEEA